MRKTKICLTGGPCAGKTTVLDFIRHEFPERAVCVPEAASILYRGGFPRSQSAEGIQAAQRAIYFTQIEMERIFEASEPPILFCDRGTLDHPAYWPGPAAHFFESVGSTLALEIARYDYVIHLQTAREVHGYEQLSNEVRRETPEQAFALDQKIMRSWRDHPRRVVIESALSFHEKIDAVFNALNRCIQEAELQELPFRKVRAQ